MSDIQQRKLTVCKSAVVCEVRKFRKDPIICHELLVFGVLRKFGILKNIVELCRKWCY